MQSKKTVEVGILNETTTRARQKHERNVRILLRFFNELHNDEERWTYIENYFLGHDLLADSFSDEESVVALASAIEKEKSYQTNQYDCWNDMLYLFDSNMHSIINLFAENEIPLPDYLQTVMKKQILNGEILMVWSKNNIIIFEEQISSEDLAVCKSKGWKAYYIYDMNVESLKNDLA